MSQIISAIYAVLIKCFSWAFLLVGLGGANNRREIGLEYLTNLDRPRLRNTINATRTKALKIPPPLAIATHDRKLASPQACPLLRSLPAEIRQQVWRECLGGITFHLELRLDHETEMARLYHFICCSPNPETCDDYPGLVRCFDHSRARRGSDEPKRHLLSLLLTCHQIYTEAAQYLYSCNRFLTTDPDVVQHLSHFLLPERINSITMFGFRWFQVVRPSLPGTSESPPQTRHAEDVIWTAVWKTFAEMEDLRELRVKFVTYSKWWFYLDIWKDSYAEHIEPLLKPVMEITRPEKFEICLPFPSRTSEALWQALPSRIQRTRYTSDLKP